MLNDIYNSLKNVLISEYSESNSAPYYSWKNSNYSIIGLYLSMINRSGFDYDSKLLHNFESEGGHIRYALLTQNQKNIIDEYIEKGDLIPIQGTLDYAGCYRISIKGIFECENPDYLSSNFSKYILEKIEKSDCNLSQRDSYTINISEKFICILMLSLGAVDEELKIQETPEFLRNVNNYIYSLDEQLRTIGYSNTSITDPNHDKKKSLNALIKRNVSLKKTGLFERSGVNNDIYLSLNNPSRIKKLNKLLFHDKSVHEKDATLRLIRLQFDLHAKKILDVQYSSRREEELINITRIISREL